MVRSSRPRLSILDSPSYSGNASRTLAFALFPRKGRKDVAASTWLSLLAQSGFMETQAKELKAQIGVLLQPALIVVEEPHRLGGFHAVGFDGLVNLSFHLALELFFIILH